MCALTQHQPKFPNHYITNHVSCVIKLANFLAMLHYTRIQCIHTHTRTHKIITTDEKSSKAFDWKIYLKFSHQIALSISHRKSSAKYVRREKNGERALSDSHLILCNRCWSMQNGRTIAAQTIERERMWNERLKKFLSCYAHTNGAAIEFSHCTIIFGTKKNVIFIDMYDIVTSNLLAVLHRMGPHPCMLWRVT